VARADASVFRGYHLVLLICAYLLYETPFVEEEEEEETNDEYYSTTSTLNVIL